MKEPRLILILLYTGAIFMLAVAGISVVVDVSAAEKTATALAMPCGILWYLLLCLAIYTFRLGRQKLALLGTVILILHSTAGNGFVAEIMARSLESPFYKTKPLSGESFDIVIVLGGGASNGGNGRIRGNGSGDRLILAAQLYHAGKTPRFACTGTTIPSIDASRLSTAEKSADILVRLGVPAEAIQEIKGRNTSEEMIAVREAFPDPDARIGVLTSAWHLPRALRLANKNGLDPHPLPADFQSGPPKPKPPGETILRFVPSADAYFTVSKMSKEYLAALISR